MSAPHRGDRARRGGRRPGWALLTALLVLAIGASTALVFTSRIELLRLGLLLALWAAVVAAFVSVTYRRQADLDQAKARDLKTVYNLQLDREISARREYELNVEAHLRRELAHEARAETNEEVAALRAELSALRTHLEILFDADLSHRPAIEHDRSAPRSVGWSGAAGIPDAPPRPDRVASTRITETDDVEDIFVGAAPAGIPGHADTEDTAESPIIDVPEEPLFTGAQPVAQHRAAGPGPGSDDVRDVEQTRWIPTVPATPPAPPIPPAPPQWMPSAPRPATRRNGSESTPAGPQPERRGRHAPPPEPETVPRHGAADDDDTATGGQSVAELLARLQHSGPTAGGRRRRRED